MKKIIGFYLVIIFVILNTNNTMADSYTFPNGQVVQSSTPNWFADAFAAGGTITASNPTDFFIASVAYINNDAAHQAAGFGASMTSDSFVCANGVVLTIVSPPSPPSPPPPPPPPPCYQSYTKYSAGPWSACSITGNWSSSVTAPCQQSRSVSAYSITALCGTDSNDSPPASSRNDILALDFVNYVSNCNSPFANGTDICTVTYDIKGPSEGIAGINGLKFQNVSYSKPIPVNQVDKTGSDGLMVLNSGIISNNKLSINFSSIVPFQDTGKVLFNIEGGGSPRTFTPITSPSNIILNFKKPYIGALGIEGDESLKVGTEQTAMIKIIQKSPLSISGYGVDVFASTLKSTDTTNFILQNLNGETGLNSNPKLNFTLNYKGTTKVTNTTLQSDPQMHYTLSGANIRYYLSETEQPNDRYLDTTNSEFLGVRVVGQIQGQGKQEITGQVKNYSEISLFNVRSTVKKNVTEMIRGMKNEDIINGVKYIEGDMTISGDQGYELLVVRNGNVTISGNLNTSGKSFGIVVLRDDQSKTGIGNVYVNNLVTSIQAYIYADGSLISSNVSGVPYTLNTAARGTALKNQLVLKGLLLTRNTIGGAIGDSGTYVLPGGSKTNDLDKAIMYDLNYIRRNYIGWDKNSNGILDAGEYKDPFVIIYDGAIKNNPPKAFIIK